VDAIRDPRSEWDAKPRPPSTLWGHLGGGGSAGGPPPPPVSGVPIFIPQSTSVIKKHTIYDHDHFYVGSCCAPLGCWMSYLARGGHTNQILGERDGGDNLEPIWGGGAHFRRRWGEMFPLGTLFLNFLPCVLYERYALSVSRARNNTLHRIPIHRVAQWELALLPHSTRVPGSIPGLGSLSVWSLHILPRVCA